MDRLLRNEIVAEVRKSMTEILEVANERWLTGDELCEQFQMFSKGWLKAYGDRLPRQRAEVMDDGVKVNYEKVQTAKDGKNMQILTKI